MTLWRVIAGTCDGPFPIYPGLVDRLTDAHSASNERDGTVAHVLGTCASYAYADAETVTPRRPVRLVHGGAPRGYDCA